MICKDAKTKELEKIWCKGGVLTSTFFILRNPFIGLILQLLGSMTPFIFFLLHQLRALIQVFFGYPNQKKCSDLGFSKVNKVIPYNLDWDPWFLELKKDKKNC